MIRVKLPRHVAARWLALACALAAVSLSRTPSQAQGIPDIAWMVGGHSGGVSSLAVSPDGQTLATASFDTSAKLFDLTSGLLMHTLTGHSVAALSVAFSPDGTRVATGGYEGNVIVWDTATGLPVAVLSGHTDGVFGLDYSHDGTMIASASADGTVKTWNAASGSLIRTLAGHTDWVYAVAFSPDDTVLASASGDATIRLWRVSDGASLGTLAGHTGFVLSLAFSPSGDTLASSSTDNSTRLWRMSDGAEIGTFTGQTLYVYDVAFSPDGTRLASGAGDGTIVIRTVADGAVERTIPLPVGVLSLAYAADGGTIFAGSTDHTISSWSAADGSFVRWITGHYEPVNSVALSPDGTMAASGSWDGTARIYAVADGTTLHELIGHTDGVSSVAFSPDSALLCTGSYDGDAVLWNTSDGSVALTVPAHPLGVASVAFSPDGSMIATGGTDAEIKLWRVSDGALLGTFTGHFSDVLSLAFSPDGQKLASGSADKTLRMWRVSDQQQLWSKTAADAWVLAVAFSPHGNTVVSGASVSATGTLKSWNVADGSPISAAAGHADPVRSVAFSPDGQVIVTGGNHDDEGRLQYWHIAGLALLQTYDQETGSGIATYGVTSVAFSPDQQKVLYGRSDATTVLCRNPFWPVPTALDVLPVTGQVGEIVTLKADLRVWLSGAPILGKDIAFSVAGTVVGSGVTDLTGRAVYDFRIPEALGVGTQDIGGSFAGDSAYGGSDGSNTLTINRANTNIIVDRVTGILGDTVTLRGTLIRTTDDSPLAGRSVTFKVESINAGSAVTDASGVATLDFAIPLGLGAGDRTISASFAGDANNLETTGYGTLVTSKRPTTLIGQDKAGSIGSPVLFEASLAFRGAPMVGATIGFAVDGVDVGLSVTDDTGNATLAYVIPEGPGAGDRAIRAEYAGDAVYAPSSAVTTLTVGPTATLCYVPDLDRTGAAGNDAVLRAYLYRETDRGAVVGRTVAFQVDGVDVGTAVTSETGRATGSYILPDGTSNGTSIVRATFAGDATYLPSSGQGKLTITVQKADTYLWIMPRLAEAGTNTYLRAYLRRTTDWEWLPGKTIAYQVDGTPVGSAVTDSGGRASLLYYVAPDFAPGDHTITGTFAGDSSYKGSTASGWMFVF